MTAQELADKWIAKEMDMEQQKKELMKAYPNGGAPKLELARFRSLLAQCWQLKQCRLDLQKEMGLTKPT